MNKSAYDKKHAKLPSMRTVWSVVYIVSLEFVLISVTGFPEWASITAIAGAAIIYTSIVRTFTTLVVPFVTKVHCFVIWCCILEAFEANIASLIRLPARKHLRPDKRDSNGIALVGK